MKVIDLNKYRKKKLLDKLNLNQLQKKKLILLVSSNPVKFLNEIREELIKIYR
jgi:hypothetical protein